MEVSILRSFLVIFIQSIIYSRAIEYDEGCYLKEPAALQVAFVMDQTGTFLLAEDNRKSFFSEFAALAPKLMEEIDKDYPGTQYALTIHADWVYKDDPPHGDPKIYGDSLHSLPEACYTRTTSFTTDKKLFQAQMLKVKALGSGEQENGLSAVAFTAADAKLGWVRNSTFTNGKPVRRVLILVTDEGDLLQLNIPRNRKDFRGDGTDTCSTSKPPTHKILKEVFEKYQMTVISLLAENSARPDLVASYKQHFEKIGGSTKYCTRSFVIKSGRSLFTDTELKEKDSKGFWAGENISGGEAEGRGVKNFKPLKDADIAELSARREKAGQYDDLIKHVKDCLKETDNNFCFFGDPESFNTLGF